MREREKPPTRAEVKGALAVQAPLAPVPGPGFTPEQMDLLKTTLMADVDASDDELRLFAEVAKRRQLDPFTRQIHALRLDGKLSFQVGIDGFRSISIRTGRVIGSHILWCGRDRKWVDVWLDDEPPAAAMAVVSCRDGGEFRRTATWKSYAKKRKDGKFTRFWRDMPDMMLGKCAEALALRAACPDDLSGLYIPEEMDQASAPKREAPPDLRCAKCGKERSIFRDGGRDWVECGCGSRPLRQLDDGMSAEAEKKALWAHYKSLRTKLGPTARDVGPPTSLESLRACCMELEQRAAKLTEHSQPPPFESDA